MQLTDYNPRDSLKPVTMETSNQGKNVRHLFLQLRGPRKYLRSSKHIHTHTHSLMDMNDANLLPIFLVFKCEINN